MKKLFYGVVASMGLAVAGAASAQTYSIGTSPQGSLGFTIGSAVARVVAEDAGLQMRVLPEGGPDVTLPQVFMGDLEMAIVSSDIAAAAFAGQGQFDGRAMDGLSVIGNLLVFSSGLIVAADSNILTLEDLAGRRVAGAFPQQKVLAQYLASTLATAGMTPDDVDIVPMSNGIRGVEALMTGNVDAAMFSPGSGIAAQADAALGGIRFLPLSAPEAADAVIRQMTPGAYAGTVAPLANRPGIEGPTPMMTGTFVLLAGPGASDQVVTAVATALLDNRPALVDVFKGFAGLDDALLVQDVIGVPVHPAAGAVYAGAGLSN